MMFPLLSVELFGWQGQSQYIGIIMAMTSASGIISAPIANYVRDNLGSYEPVFWGIAVMSLALMGLYAVLYVMTKRTIKQFEAQQAK